MNVTITRDQQEVTARFSGRLDTPASQDIANDVNTLLEAADKTLILDCEDMTYISSSGLRIFLTLRKAAAEKGGRVIVRNLSDSIQSVFMMTGFLNLFEIQ